MHFSRTGVKVRLSRIPVRPPRGITKEEANERLAELGGELFQLQDLMWGARTRSLLIVLQGRDAAGKDGAIKHVVGHLNPRGVQVASFGVPTQVEREHDFLWRVHQHAPRLGEVSVFNRSHYEDVLVVRVNQLVPKPAWHARYGQIRAFEDTLVASGTILLKFFLHISREEQEERLLAREADPRTSWKLNVRDWQDRELWPAYTAAYQDAISRTSTPHAPWHVVPSDSKWYRNLVVAETVVAALRPYQREWRGVLRSRGKVLNKELKVWRKDR
jgi:PPK2 family polyphosphate:nucleotide phosphotransferase